MENQLSDFTNEEIARALEESAATIRASQRRLRSKIVDIAAWAGWDLSDPRAVERSLWTEFGYEVSEDVLYGVAADAAIDAAYPRRGCPERIALGTVADEAMEASTP